MAQAMIPFDKGADRDQFSIPDRSIQRIINNGDMIVDPAQLGDNFVIHNHGRMAIGKPATITLHPTTTAVSLPSPQPGWKALNGPAQQSSSQQTPQTVRRASSPSQEHHAQDYPMDGQGHNQNPNDFSPKTLPPVAKDEDPSYSVPYAFNAHAQMPSPSTGLDVDPAGLNDRNWQCDICQVWCNSTDEMQAHREHYHPFCSLCAGQQAPKRFHTLAEFETHMREHHYGHPSRTPSQEDLRLPHCIHHDHYHRRHHCCNICHEYFTRQNKLLKHRKNTHPKCQHCPHSTRFSSFTELSRHKESEHPSRHKRRR